MNDTFRKCAFSVGNARVEILIGTGFFTGGRSNRDLEHCHTNVEVHYITDGKLVLHSKGEATEISKGDLILIPKTEL